MVSPVIGKLERSLENSSGEVESKDIKFAMAMGHALKTHTTGTSVSMWAPANVLVCLGWQVLRFFGILCCLKWKLRDELILPVLNLLACWVLV